MKKIILIFILPLTLLIAEMTLMGTQLTTTQKETSNGEYTIVPGLYGFGTNTRAAYGHPTLEPKILHVNTLSGKVSNTDATHGSFRWAVTRPYPRVVVFDVSGVIDLGEADNGGKGENQIYLKGDEMSYMTIAGHTAPGPITILGGGIIFMVKDTLIQHVAFRYKQGQHRADDDLWETASDNGNLISYKDYYGSWGNHVLDHCSLSWGVDQNMGISSNVTNVTVSNCIIAEGIRDHSCGALMYGKNIFYSGNLFAHNKNRQPYLKVESEVVFWNNLIYNPGYKVAQIEGVNDYDNAPVKFDFRGNDSIKGSDSPTNPYPLVSIGAHMDNNHLELYMADNINYGVTKTGFNVLNLAGIPYESTTPPLAPPPNAAPYSSALTKMRVLTNAGARPADRDAVDTRIVNEVNSGTGSIPTEIPTLPAYPITNRAFVPVANPHKMYSEHYTNLEHQLHQLVVAVEN